MSEGSTGSSLYWLTKGGDVQGKDYSGDLITKQTANDVKRRFDATYLEDTDIGNATATLTTAQVRKGLMYSDPGAAATFTTPTAALLVAADADSDVGRGYEFIIVNKNGVNAITLGSGVGVTLVGSVTVAVNSSARFYVRYTNVGAGNEAIDIFRL